jgi:glycosyltransferase involved in cell wall biosynthesis
MQVLHVFKSYIPDNFTGIPRVIETLAESTRPLGLTNSVLTLSPHVAAEQPLRVGSHDVYQAPLTVNIRSSGFSVQAFELFRKLRAEADILHYHFPWPMGDMLHLAAGARKPAIVTYHCDIVKQKVLRYAYAPLMHRFLAQMDAIVSTSPNYAASSPVLQRYPEKTKIIPIGIAPEPPADPARVAHWRAKLGEGFFLFIGSHRYYKGLPFLIEAVRHCDQKIALIGEVNEAQIEDRPETVTVIGKVNDADKSAILELCRGLVLPSHLRAEAFGVVLLEAMRAGKPIITCDIGSGMNYVNRHEQTGLIIAPRDPDALAGAMTRLAADPTEAARFGTAGRARFEAKFQADVMARRYFDLYTRLLSKP